MGWNQNQASPAIWGCAGDIYKPSCEDEKFLARKKTPEPLKKPSAILELGGQKKTFFLLHYTYIFENPQKSNFIF